jgi:hypothetical protein
MTSPKIPILIDNCGLRERFIYTEQDAGRGGEGGDEACWGQRKSKEAGGGLV